MRYLHEEELKTASRYLFLSMAIIVIDKDIEHIEKGPFKIKETYLNLLNNMTTIAKNERRILRKKMYDNKISVVPTEKNDTFTTYLFLARGYEEEKRYFNPAIRKNVEKIYKELIVGALNQLTKQTSGG